MTAFESKAFPAMGTEVEVLAAPSLPPGSFERVRSFFGDVEARFSRFRPDSELSMLNLSAGSPFPASPMFVEVLCQALAAAQESADLFDPLVLPQLEAAGYWESIDSVRRSVHTQTAVAAGPTYKDIEVFRDGTVIIPTGSGLDFGGFVKGWAVDRVVEMMALSDNWCVNAGGDLLAHGAGPHGSGWVVGVEDPFTLDQDIALLGVKDRAVATSSTMRRRWNTLTGTAHHLIDPRTGRPSETDLASVTVIAPTVARAEVLAKQLILLGSRDARDYGARHQIATLMVDGHGSVLISDWMESYLVV